MGSSFTITELCIYNILSLLVHKYSGFISGILGPVVRGSSFIYTTEEITVMFKIKLRMQTKK
jgi:hypothetical protein